MTDIHVKEEPRYPGAVMTLNEAAAFLDGVRGGVAVEPEEVVGDG